ncbi:hypothetical protein CFP56_008350 [Quercus suber]|uniref:Uncharacterized protein n=1 Tax=Quercus suber TaxID=58331 RepID=A0AAW0L676_QUESU
MNRKMSDTMHEDIDDGLRFRNCNCFCGLRASVRISDKRNDNRYRPHCHMRRISSYCKKSYHFREMEAMKLKFFVALMVVLMAISSVQKAAAIFVPTFFASLVALAFGLVF